MSFERSKYWDCVKGCAIISVVLGHGFSITHDFVYAFHLALFFFVSGWFYSEEKYGNVPETLFAARMKTVWPKYVVYSTVLILLHLASQNFLGLEMVREKFSIGSALTYCLESCVFHINDYLTGSMWFIPQLVFAATLFGLIVWFSKRRFFGEKQVVKHTAIIAICVITGAIGSILSMKGMEVAGGYHLQYVFKAVPVYMVAYYSRSLYELKGEKLLNLPVALLCLTALVLSSIFHVEVGIDAGPLSFYGLGLAGIYFILNLCKYINKVKWLCIPLSVVGEYSFEIMAFNVIIYFMFNAVFSRIDGTVQNIFSLNYYQQYWFVQVPVLLGIPCLIGLVYKKLRQCLIR